MHTNQRHLTIARIGIIGIPFLILFTAVSALAASVSLRWDPNNPTPEGYRVFARRSDQVYNYTLPDWEGSTVTCTINNLEDQTDYYFVVRAYDGILESADSEEVHFIPADPANQSPVAVDDSYTVDEGSTLSIAATSGVLANDSDPEGDALSVSLASGMAHGTLTLNADGSFTYIHDSTDTVADGFSYTLSDGHGNTDTGRVSITINPVNDPTPPALNQPPIAGNDGYTLAEGGTLSITAAGGLLANDSDPEGDALSVSLASGVAHGTLTLNADGSFTYIHDSGETLSDRFTYSLSDGQGNTDAASVAITITPINDAPTARAGSDRSVAEGLSVTLDGSGSIDPDNATLSFLWEQIGGPSASLSSANSVRPTVTAPQVDTGGAILEFRLTVRDAAGAKSTDACRVTVTNTVDDAPLNNPDTDADGLADSTDQDDDDDGMPDDWENLFGLNPMVNDADGDLDGDGIGNRDEYRAGLEPDDPGEGTAPGKPTAVSPVSYAQVACNPEIKLQAYSDADGDAHIATQWQAYDANTGDCLLDVVTDRRLDRLRVPRLLLNGNRTYYWRVRFFDSGGRASEWSTANYFTTDEAADDLNGNGIPDDQEGGDVQADVSRSVSMTATACQPTEIAVASQDTIAEIKQVVLLDPAEFEIDETTPARLPSAMLAYKLVLDQPGQRALVTIHLSDPAPEGARWLKYDAVNGWQDYSDHAVFSADCQSVTVEVKDGAFGDADGVANGVIVDPAGLSATADGSASTASTSGSSDGGGGGCFISAIHHANNQSAATDGPWQWIKARLNRLMAEIVGP